MVGVTTVFKVAVVSVFCDVSWSGDGPMINGFCVVCWSWSTSAPSWLAD